MPARYTIAVGKDGAARLEAIEAHLKAQTPVSFTTTRSQIVSQALACLCTTLGVDDPLEEEK